MDRVIATDRMKKCTIEIPQDPKDQLVFLNTIFGSHINLVILRRFCNSTEIFQRDIIREMDYTNKTIIGHLLDLVREGILREHMSKDNGTWIKSYTLLPYMQWILPIVEQSELPQKKPDRPKEWNRDLREKIRDRDNYTCQLCGKSQYDCDRSLSVHHIDFDKNNNDPDNLITLCRHCHLKAGSRKNKKILQKKIEGIIKKKKGRW